jgi:signal transduction histidine kinase
LQAALKRSAPDHAPQISPYLELVNQILADVASSYDADISTLYRVSRDRTRLGLEAVYDSRGKVELEGEPYKLEWPSLDHDQRMGHGVPCWVAEHGEPLFMPNLAHLRRHPAYGGCGAWDGKLFRAAGVDDPATGFGCFYAVPLRTGKGPPRDTVIGVFKIERRRHKKVFDEHERKAFDLAATSISRALQKYLSTDTTLRRVLSEAAHVLRGRLSDSRSVLEMSLLMLDQPTPDVAYVRSNLPRAESLLKGASRRIERVLEAYRGPQFPTDFRLKEIVEAAIEAGFANPQRCDTSWETVPDATIQLTSVQRYDLETILLNLLRNADEHSGTRVPVRLHIRSAPDLQTTEFRIVDHGGGIRREVVERARAAAASGTEEEALLVVRGSGTGLRRVFHFAKEYQWEVVHDCPADGGTTFRVTVPNETGLRQ